MATSSIYSKNTQNELLLQNLLEFYQNNDHMNQMLHIINGASKISLRIVDWFVTNYSKQYDIIYEIPMKTGIVSDSIENKRFKVYNHYKLKLKAYSKKRFDPFCRRDRITVPYNGDKYMETTIGQLNFFKWAIENRIIEYIEAHYNEIEKDMNNRNSSSNSRKQRATAIDTATRTRKKREELSIFASKSVKKEVVQIVVKFND